METITITELMNDWIAARLALRPSTLYGHDIVIRTYILPLIGDMEVNNITSRKVQKWLATLAEKGLSRRTLEYAWTLLDAALNTARAWGEDVPDIHKIELPPKGGEREVIALSRDEMAALISAAASHRLGISVKLALLCGLRRGEILGLHWEDIDYNKHVVHIRHSYVRVLLSNGKYGHALQPPKSAAGKRDIPMPRELEDALRFHRRFQRYEQKRLVTSNSPVIATRSGGYILPSHMQKWIKKWAAAAQIETHWHALRHTYATMLAASGASMKTLAYLLGHSDPAFTIRVYAHVNAEILKEDIDNMMNYINNT